MSLYDDLMASDRRPLTRVLSFEMGPASNAVARDLGIPEGDDVYSITRLRYADNDPLAVLRNQIPTELVKLNQ